MTSQPPWDAPLTPSELRSYFSRINYTSPDPADPASLHANVAGLPPGPLGVLPTLDTLTDLISAHLRHIAFENLDLHAKKYKPDAIIPSEEEGPVKLLGKRGGWCFAHNGLLKRALLGLGYKVTDLGCRVTMPPAEPDQVEHAASPYGHRALAVEVPPLSSLIAHVGTGHRTPRKRYLVDVGFGSHSVPFCPILMPSKGEGRSAEVWRIPGTQGWRLAEGRYPYVSGGNVPTNPGTWEAEMGCGWYLQSWVLGAPKPDGTGRAPGRWIDAYWFDPNASFFWPDFASMALTMTLAPTSPFIGAPRLSIWLNRTQLDSILSTRGLAQTPDLDPVGRNEETREKGVWLVTCVGGSVAVRIPEGNLVKLEDIEEGTGGMLKAWKDYFAVEL